MGSDENCRRQIAKVRLSVISIAIQIQWRFETQLYRWAVFSNNRPLEFGNNLKLFFFNSEIYDNVESLLASILYKTASKALPPHMYFSRHTVV